MNRVRGLVLALILAAILPSGAAFAQQDESFMPKGGKTLLLELFGDNDVVALRDFITTRRTEAEWLAALAAKNGALSDRERAELAAYASINLPLSADAAEKATTRPSIAAVLPPDGRELAWTQCQFCHSLFTGYLMHQRDVQGWRNIFLSPFHRGMKMTAAARETFARYSAINMPMKKEDVPADLRY